MTDTAGGVINQLAVSTLLVIGTAGCSSLNTFHDTAILWKSTSKAYRDLRGVSVTGKYSRHYTKGWKQGYFDVADGGSPTPPAIAPRKYWGLKWKKPEGRKCVEAWFCGRADGAAAAVEDGWLHFNYVPVGSVEAVIPFDVGSSETVVPMESVEAAIAFDVGSSETVVPMESVEAAIAFDIGTPETVVRLEAIPMKSCTLSDRAEELSTVVEPGGQRGCY